MEKIIEEKEFLIGFGDFITKIERFLIRNLFYCVRFLSFRLVSLIKMLCRLIEIVKRNKHFLIILVAFLIFLGNIFKKLKFFNKKPISDQKFFETLNSNKITLNFKNENEEQISNFSKNLKKLEYFIQTNNSISSKSCFSKTKPQTQIHNNENINNPFYTIIKMFLLLNEKK